MDEDLSKKTVLIVEDENSLSESLSKKLGIEGFAVKRAINGQKAWEKIQSREIDLILLDVIMPEKDGVWLVEQMRKSDEFSYIPVIVLTNLGYGSKLDKLAREGVFKILLKTEVSMEEIVGNIKEVLRIKEKE